MRIIQPIRSITPGTSRQVSKTTPQPRRNMSCCKKSDEKPKKTKPNPKAWVEKYGYEFRSRSNNNGRK